MQQHLDLTIDRQGMIELSCGLTSIRLSQDLAYDLQHQLASLLARLELEDYPEEDTAGDHVHLSESREALAFLAACTRPRKLHS